MINLILGDCLEKMKGLETHSVDLILTDPPYGSTSCKWDVIIPLDLMWQEILRVLKPKGTICLFGNQPFTTILIQSNLSYFKYCLTWVKNKPTGMSFAKYQPMRDSEDIVVFYKQKATYNPIKQKSKSPTSLYNSSKGYKNSGNTQSKIDGVISTQNKWNEYVNPRTTIFFDVVPMRKGRLHPTQKPVDLLTYLIKTYSNENETILDFTMGSGSTGVSALLNNRKFIGIEKDEKYFNIAEKRINDSIISMNSNQLI